MKGSKIVKGIFSIFYFSGTGNTWWITQQIAEALQEQGLEVKAYSIEQIPPTKSSRVNGAGGGRGVGFPHLRIGFTANFHGLAERAARPEGEETNPGVMLHKGCGLEPAVIFWKRFIEKKD